MQDWREALCARLGPDLAARTGLDDSDSVEAFEERLGALLAWGAAIDEIQRFPDMSSDDLGSHASLDSSLRLARSRFEQFVHELDASLFYEFGVERFDVEGAARAYGTLFQLATGSPPGSTELPDRLICATTNYDRSIELALERLIATPRTGFANGRALTPEFDPRGLGKFQSGSPSVLYLHGAVGWYITPSGAITAHGADDAYSQALGRPAVLYPGPDKDVVRAPTAGLWRELDEALAEATHILVVGHRLADRHLVRALERSRTAVGIVTRDVKGQDGRRQLARREKWAHITTQLPRAQLIPGSFGVRPMLDFGTMLRWRKAVVA
jgi:hypothetical protein